LKFANNSNERSTPSFKAIASDMLLCFEDYLFLLIKRCPLDQVCFKVNYLTNCTCAS